MASTRAPSLASCSPSIATALSCSTPLAPLDVAPGGSDAESVTYCPGARCCRRRHPRARRLRFGRQRTEDLDDGDPDVSDERGRYWYIERTWYVGRRRGADD